jgi:hypothetical protein
MLTFGTVAVSAGMIGNTQREEKKGLFNFLISLKIKKSSIAFSLRVIQNL